jgi:hypothetical protein
VQASVLGADSVVGGCIAAGIDQAWHRMTDSMPAPAGQ